MKFSQLIGDTTKKLKLFTNKKECNTIKIS